MSRRRTSRRVAVSLGAAAALLAAMQLVRRPDTANPPADPARAMAAHVDVPPEVLGVLRRSCFDCHSHETRWPAYARVAPASWLVARDVRAGRADLNFSDWSTDAERGPTPAQRLGGICADARRGIMPPRAYLAMHPSARLSGGDVALLCAWSARARQALAARDSARS